MSTSRFASLSLPLSFVPCVVSAQTDLGVQSDSHGTGATIIDPSNDPNGSLHFSKDGLNHFQEVETVSNSSAFPDLAKAISDALERWKLKPYVSDGKPAEVGTGILFGRIPHITAPHAAESAVH